ncbi:MAG: ATP-dependent helicase [Clostridia bacterium]|nr:ATP-dependent helicase [Clostridia bacterium]
MTEFDKGMMDSGLNRSQRKFCKLPLSHNIRLLAPAGSGKTYSLLWRCRYIKNEYLQRGLQEPVFLIVTFTRSAKFELEERLASNPCFNGIRATVSTLNAWGWDFLKSKTGKELAVTAFQRKNLVNHDLLPVAQKYERIGGLLRQARGQAQNAPVIIDLMDTLKAFGFTHTMRKSEFNAHLRYLKEIELYPLYKGSMDALLRSEKVNTDDKKERDDAEWEFFTFWKEAVVRLEASNRYTMEDQKYWARILLDERIADSRYSHAAAQYTHILVDEFQDINPLDLDLIQAISLYHGNGKPLNTIISGDDDQAIFGWRGTTPKFILNPEKYFNQPFDTAVLDTNYRSPATIVEAADKLIRYNRDRVEKDMKSTAPGRAYIRVDYKKKAALSVDAAIRLIQTLLEEKGCRNVALISRRQASLFPYQVLLSAANIPYHVAADIDIFEGEAVQSLQSIIQIIYRAKADDSDDPVNDLLTICDKVDRYQLQTKEKQTIRAYLERHQPDSLLEAVDVLRRYDASIKNMPPACFCDAVTALYNAKTVYEFLDVLIENCKGFEQDFTKADKDNHYKNPQFVLLKELSTKYGSDLRRLYKDIDKARRSGEISRRRESDATADGYRECADTRIHLVTATRSKGSEYDAVIIIDCVHDEWPSSQSTDIEEERRLFYVAMTRPRKYLCFMTYGTTCSRFLLEAGLTPR